MQIDQIGIIPTVSGMKNLWQGIGIALQVEPFFPEHFTSFCGSCVAQLCGVQQLLLKIGIQRGKIVASEDYKITLELFSTICICAVLTVVQVLAPPGAQETQCVLHTEVLQCSKRGKSRVADDSLAPELVQAFCPSLVAIKTVSRGRRSSLA